MRIAFIDHSYHKKTLSPRFFLDIMAGIGNAELFYDETWCNGENKWRSEFKPDNYDLIVIWQAFEAFEVLKNCRHPRIVFVPMYDGMLSNGAFQWRSHFNAVKCLSFSHKLHREITERGGLSEYFKFFPDPGRERVITSFDELRPYFWYRSNSIGGDTIAALLGNSDIRRLTVHNAPDPHQEPFRIRSLAESIKELRITRWYESKSEYTRELLRHNVFFAPRPVEGIGFSFLEAMAMGMCVVAPNASTINEYIVDDKNGLLYDPEAPGPLNFSQAKTLGARARETIEKGFEEWKSQIDYLIEYLITPVDYAKLSKALVAWKEFREKADKSPGEAFESNDNDKIIADTFRISTDDDVAESCFVLKGFLDPEGPYPDINIPRIRWAIGPAAEVTFRNDHKPHLMRCRVAAYLKNQVIFIRGHGKLLARIDVPVLGNNKNAFIEFVIDLKKLSHVTSVTLEFAVWETDAERPIAVMVSGLECD